MISVAEEILRREYEQVSFFEDAKTGCVAIVAIHSTVLGPALGGCRMNQYPSREAALLDVLRLAEGMSYKNSLAGLNLGGGKSVIIADRNLRKGREELFESFGGFISSFGGRYYTAEDMGTSVDDMNSVLHTCPYVAGRDPRVGGGGDPSPHTAEGVFYGMRACLERVFESDSFKDRHVVVQGVGHVGTHLVRLLAEAGARVSVTDSNSQAVKNVCETFGARTVVADKVYDTDCDIFAPCAVGGIINPDTVKRLKTKIIAGAANNQIYGEGVEQELRRRGILYAPDFAINSGGVILCADELEPGGYTPKRVDERVARIYETIRRIIDRTYESGELPGDIAIRLAKQRIEEARRKAA
jgi:leucine dehydrogenase